MRSFIAKIGDKKLELNDPHGFGDFVKKHKGRNVRITPVSGEVSDQARGYYFGAVIPLLQKLVTAWSRIESDDVHEILKKEFNGFEAFNPVTGQKERFGRSIAIKDNGKFQEYLLRIGEWLMENYTQSMPDPEDYKNWVNSSPLKGEKYAK